MSEDKNAAESLLDAAKAKINEGADRARAAGHDLAAKVGNNPLENAEDKAKAVADRARAEGHNAEANAEYNQAKRES